jgi:hypothetical protein
MNCLEAKSAADELKKATMPIQKYAEGEEINGLPILHVRFPHLQTSGGCGGHLTVRLQT